MFFVWYSTIPFSQKFTYIYYMVFSAIESSPKFWFLKSRDLRNFLCIFFFYRALIYVILGVNYVTYHSSFQKKEDKNMAFTISVLFCTEMIKFLKSTFCQIP